MKIEGGLKVFCFVACLALVSQTLACVYALTGSNAPGQEHVRILAVNPEKYVLHVETGEAIDTPVPPDGRTAVAIPAYLSGCKVYLLGVVKVSNGRDPLKDWSIAVISNRRTVRKLSLRQLVKLPTDSEGYRLLKIAG
jgi:hypothetical protein